MDQLLSKLADKLPGLCATAGLVSKTFLYTTPHEPAGFYLFESRADADSYITGEFFKGFASSPAISNVRIQHYSVSDEPSKALGTPSVPIVARDAAE